jgi:hypothetical protein
MPSEKEVGSRAAAASLATAVSVAIMASDSTPIIAAQTVAAVINREEFVG